MPRRLVTITRHVSENSLKFNSMPLVTVSILYFFDCFLICYCKKNNQIPISFFKVSGALISVYLLEKSRTVQLAKDERTFHVFYQVICFVCFVFCFLFLFIKKICLVVGRCACRMEEDFVLATSHWFPLSHTKWMVSFYFLFYFFFFFYKKNLKKNVAQLFLVWMTRKNLASQRMRLTPIKSTKKIK